MKESNPEISFALLQECVVRDTLDKSMLEKIFLHFLTSLVEKLFLCHYV